MADTKDTRLATSVQKDPNFAVICSFLTKYGTLLGLTDVSFDQLERWIEDTRYGECRVSPTIFIVVDNFFFLRLSANFSIEDSFRPSAVV